MTFDLHYYWPAYTWCSWARLGRVAGVCRRLSTVTQCICNVTHQGAARGGPVVLRPIRATPCLACSFWDGSSWACSQKVTRDGRWDSETAEARLNKYIGPPYCRAEMYAGHVACCPWWDMVSMPLRRTDRRMEGCLIIKLRFLLNCKKWPA